ncbi:MAG: DNA alkylation repair protein, partial [Bdellovibrionales bacterium]
FYRKVFKIKTIELNKNDEFEIKKSHSLRPITTMKYYAGNQHLEIQINGNSCSKKMWQLKK